MVKKIGAYARLLRLSNGPTAVADVWMGYAVATGALTPTWPLALMTLASLLFYHAGMIGNDLADVFDDRAEGRDRPIARGEVFGWDAMRLRGWMEKSAFVLAAVAGYLQGVWWPLFIAFALWSAVRCYNSPMKRSLAGPLVMGLCRGLNVCLGASVATLRPESLTTPVGVTLYIAGVTLYARDERLANQRRQLMRGALISTLGVVWLAAWPYVAPGSSSLVPPASWLVFWGAAFLIAVRGMVAAIVQPTPRNIGRGVGIAIQGLVVIDATLATLYAGPTAGLAILALLPVTMLLARWIPQT